MTRSAKGRRVQPASVRATARHGSSPAETRGISDELGGNASRTLPDLTLAELSDLFDPVPLQALRALVQTTPVGRRLQTSYLAGFRPQKLPRQRLLRAFRQALADELSDLEAALVDAWVRNCAAATSICEETLGRKDPFKGPSSPEFFDRLEIAYSPATIRVLRSMVPPASSPPPPEVGEDEQSPYREVTEDAGKAAEASESSGTVPIATDSLVELDRWIQHHPDAQPELIRLVDIDMPDSARVGDWQRYAEAAGQTLEGLRDFEGALAYWLAAVHAMVAADAIYASAPPQVLRAAKCMAAMHRDRGWAETGSSVDAVLRTGLEALSSATRRAALSALIALVSISEWIYDSLELSTATRALVGKAVDEFLTEQSRRSRAKGMHEVIPALARARLTIRDELATLIKRVNAAPTFNRIAADRQAFIRGLSAFEPFLTATDAQLAAALRSLFGETITNYLEAGEQAEERAHTDTAAAVDEALEYALRLHSEFSRCLALPSILGLRVAMERHYLGIVSARQPRIEVMISKSAVVDGATWNIEMHVRNTGSGAASDCTIGLHPLGVDHLSFKEMSIGRLEAGSVHVLATSVSGPSDADELDLEADIAYRDRSGRREGSDLLTVSRQRSVDWEEIETLPIPYRIQSITEPERLKGRTEQLRQLRYGFRAKASFMVTGQKRVGKTSLVRVFLRELENVNDALAIYISMGELSAASGTEDLGRLGHELCSRVLEEYEARFGRRSTVETPTVEAFRDSFNATFSGFVRRLRREHRLEIAFALDDFDELPSQLFTGSVGRALFLALRSLIDSGTTFLFVGSERLPSIIEEQAERLNQVGLLRVDYLDHAAIGELAREPVEGILEWAEDAIGELEQWSARNPYFAVLICDKVWARSIRNRDYLVTANDVRKSTEELAQASDRNSYQHFWSDSALTADSERRHAEERSASVVWSLAEAQPSPAAFARRTDVIGHAPDLAQRDADAQLELLISRQVVETHRQDTSLIRLRIPVFALWLQSHGIGDLRAQSRDAAHSPRTPELAPEEVSELAADLMYRGVHVTTDNIRRWLSQFGHLDDQRVMLPLLRGVGQFGLFRQDRFLNALESLDRLVRSKVGQHGFPVVLDRRDRPRNRWVTHADAVGKSGAAAVRTYRAANGIHESYAGSPRAVLKELANASGKSVLVCVNDFIGSGHSAVEGMRRNVLPLLDTVDSWQDRIALVLAAVVGLEDGVHHVEDELGGDVLIVVDRIITRDERAFSPENAIWDADEQRRRARDLAHRIGSQLEKRHPLGWEDSEGLVVFPDTVPNNTLPILYKTGARVEGQDWYPLFPRS